jgi:hypothetical protein
MENTDPRFSENPEGSPKPIETDYSKHEQDPGPSPQAVNEENNKGAGPTMKWIIPILIIILAILYWIFFQHHSAK